MQTEFVQTMAYLIAGFIIIYVIASFINGYYNKKIKPFKFTDRFELGYIEDNQPSVPVDVVITDNSEEKLISEMEKQIKTLQSKLSKIEKKEAKKPKEDQLFNDCVATLMTLGYKSKRVAKNDVSDFLVNNDISSVDQFVNEFFKNARKI